TSQISGSVIKKGYGFRSHYLFFLSQALEASFNIVVFSYTVFANNVVQAGQSHSDEDDYGTSGIATGVSCTGYHAREDNGADTRSAVIRDIPQRRGLRRSGTR